MPSTPLTCCSIGCATVSTSVLALAPGYVVVTWIVGGVMFGYCATGSVNSATPPITSVRIAMTLARTGRSMKNFEIIAGLFGVVVGKCLQLRLDLLSRRGLQQPDDDDFIFHRQPRLDAAEAAERLADRDLSLLNDIIGVHDEDIAAALVGADR